MNLIWLVPCIGFLTGALFGVQLAIALAYGRGRGIRWNDLTPAYFFLPLGSVAITLMVFLARLAWLFYVQAPEVQIIWTEDEDWSWDKLSAVNRVFLPLAIASTLVFAMLFVLAGRLRGRIREPYDFLVP